MWKHNTLEKWESEWAEHKLSHWTHTLFPIVKERLNSKGSEPNFWSTQALTNHGVFKEYLAKHKRASSSRCPCDFDDESAKHVVQDCIRSTAGRLVDWSTITANHIKYMERTVLKLWMLENPNFTLRRKK